MAFSRYFPDSKLIYDPDIAPTKPIQNIHAKDSARWQQQSKSRFDTTYRSEYINRIRHPNEIAKSTRPSNSSLSQYSVLPPINSAVSKINNDHPDSRAPPVTNRTTAPQLPFRDQEVPINEIKPRDVPPLSLQNDNQYFYDQQQQQQQQQQPMMSSTVDSYLPEEPVLLTDYEEKRLLEQIRTQLAYSGAIDKLKLFYQELVKYDSNLSNYVHYSVIQTLAYQLGLNLNEETLRFAMCKFVAPERSRGYVNYEDLVRYFGKCLSDMHPNPYGQQQDLSPRKYDFDNGFYNRATSGQIQYPTKRSAGSSLVNEYDAEDFDPDERQVRVLLKQNLKYFDVNGAVDFDKLYREFKIADRNQTGVLNRQQIEEVIYKVRIPLQRSLLFQILEKHCRAYLRLYRWEAFLQYLKQQILDVREVQDRSSPIYTQYASTRNQWLDYMRRAYSENERLKIIQRYTTQTEGPRLESNHPSAWFARFLRLTNAMYSYRINSSREQEFLLPREEARRLFRAYNQIWDLSIEEDKIQRVLDASARNGDTNIDEALLLLAK